ncbi:MAG: ankyrin repeat domain-containing protein [Porphyrobacter sp.]|nr:ankyrin repeat domain-containing protein [Porphyrobacter sp.]
MIAAILAVGTPAAAQTKSDGYKFLDAVKDKNANEVDALLRKPGSQVVNSRDLSNGRTALHIVVDMRDVTWIRYLLNRGANPNTADNRGVTPLMRASQLGYVDGVEALVAGGARVDNSNDAGETPLILAVHRKDTSMMRVLLKAGADPDRADNSGRTARDYARGDGANSAALAEIENSRAPVGVRTGSGQTYGPSL